MDSSAWQLLLSFDNGFKYVVHQFYGLRSLFIWRPKEESEPVQQRDEKKIVVCGSEKKTKRKSGGVDSDNDSEDDDAFRPKGKNFKSKKLGSKLTPKSRKH